MKSTEQTARKVLKCEECQAKYDNGCDGGTCPELEDCIAVAEIQRKITIDKACEWLEGYMEKLSYIDEWCRYGEDDFRKAMEE